MYALTPCRSWSTNEGSLAVIPVYQQGCRDTAHFPRHILMQGAWSGSCRSVLVFQPTSGANDLPFQICKNFRGISSDTVPFSLTLKKHNRDRRGCQNKQDCSVRRAVP